MAGKPSSASRRREEQAAIRDGYLRGHALRGHAAPLVVPEQPYGPRQTTPPPPFLEIDTWRKIAAALSRRVNASHAARCRQDDDARQRVVDEFSFSEDDARRRLRVVAEFNERIASGEEWAAVTAPPTAFTERPFAAWFQALLQQGAADADALLLALLVWLRLEPAEGRDIYGAVADFLLELARVDDSPANAARALMLMTDAPQTQPRRRRPKGPSKKTLDYVAQRRAAVRAHDLECDPWTLLHDLAEQIEKRLAIDDGPTNDVSKSRSGAGQHWYGNHTRKLPSLRRYTIVEALADHCVAWWLDKYRAETTPPSQAGV